MVASAHTRALPPSTLAQANANLLCVGKLSVLVFDRDEAASEVRAAERAGNSVTSIVSGPSSLPDGCSTRVRANRKHNENTELSTEMKVSCNAPIPDEVEMVGD